jgi:FtsP/CotA-like multicopper oxidase with cupredoxin domain
MLAALAAAVGAALMLWGSGAIGSGAAATIRTSTASAQSGGCKPSEISGWKPVPCLALTDPAQIYAKHPRGGGHGTLNVELTASRRTIEVSGSPLSALPFTFKDLDAPVDQPATLIGPTLHVHPGDRIHVKFVNALGNGRDGMQRPTNIHYHGLHVSPLGVGDNVFRTFDDGHTYESVVDLPTNHPPGTYWYHVHLHGDANAQLSEGLEDLLPDGWSHIRQRQMALRDVQVKDDALLDQPNPADGTGDSDPAEPSTRLVNALYQPTFGMKAKRYELWRLANVAANVFSKIQLRELATQKKADFVIIAEDGVPVWKVTRHDTLVLPPGKRFDVLVMLPKPGKYALKTLPFSQNESEDKVPGAKPARARVTPIAVPATTETLATITVAPSSGPVLPRGDLPKRLATRDDLSRAHVDHRHTFRFSYVPPFTGSYGRINGKPFTPGMMPVDAPYLGTVEEWTLINESQYDHPFHIHVNGFQVMSVEGRPVHANGHQDIVNIPKQHVEHGKLVNGRVVIRQRFETYTGWFVFHCHILEHEDVGMMAAIQVRNHGDPRQPAPESAGTPAHGGH